MRLVRRVLTSSLAVAAVSLGLVSPDAYARPIPRDEAAVPASASELQQIKVRGQFGLDSTIGHVRTVNADKASTTTELGIPLTGAESKDVAGRSVLGDLAVRITDAENDDPAFGGIWIDQAYNPGLGQSAMSKASRIAAQFTAQLIY